MATEDVDIRSLVTGLGVTRYDLLLVAIPLSLGLAVLVGAVLPVPEDVAVGVGSIVAAAAVGDGLFRNPPHRPSPA